RGDAIGKAGWLSATGVSPHFPCDCTSEPLQLPLPTIWSTGTFGEKAFAAIRPAFGDALLGRAASAPSSHVPLPRPQQGCSGEVPLRLRFRPAARPLSRSAASIGSLPELLAIRGPKSRLTHGFHLRARSSAMAHVTAAMAITEPNAIALTGTRPSNVLSGGSS